MQSVWMWTLIMSMLTPIGGVILDDVYIGNQTQNSTRQEQPCDINKRLFASGSTFFLDSNKLKCHCVNGVYNCSSLCPNEESFPVFSDAKCVHPVLEKLEHSVCSVWRCEKEYDLDVKITNECKAPEECLEASSCYKTIKLLYGTERDVRTAQRMYCGSVGKIPPNKDTRYAYNPMTNDIGPLVCCKRGDYVPVTHYPERCSKRNPYLRLKSCGRTPLFFLNHGSKYYLDFKDEYYNRLKKEGCGTTANPFIKHVPGKREAATRKKRIAGGYPARIGQFPYLAQIYYADYNHLLRPFFGCIATIIHHQMVLTTAHCTIKGHIKEVWVGQYDLNNITYENFNYQWVNEFKYELEATPQVLEIQGATRIDGALNDRINRTLINPSDVAIVTTTKPIKFNDFVEPVCMPLEDSHYSIKPHHRRKFYAVGYAFQSQFKNKALPRFIELKMTSTKWCEDTYSHYFSKDVQLPIIDNILPKVFCAAPNTEWEGPCSMDEGSPLLTLGPDGRMYQVGIMLNQLPETCGFSDRPAMYLSTYAQQANLLDAMKKAFNVTDNKIRKSACLTTEERAYNKTSLL